MKATRSPRDEDRAIARSVLFASLFDYPLTLAQLRQTLIESVQTPSQILSTYLSSEPLQAAIDYRDGFFFPRGCDQLVEERRRREARSRAFLHHHRVLLRLICLIPYVRMVALSGSIAHLNLERSGDLDLFIVTRGRRVWSVTVAVLVLAKLFRRRAVVCANFTMADTRLTLDQQDLFSASQIIHLKPLVGEEMYRRFVASNAFVGRFYPNFRAGDPASMAFRREPRFIWIRTLLERLCAWPSAGVEAICRWGYRRHLLRQAASWQSPDQVQLDIDCLKLHTQSHRRSVLDRFERTVSDCMDSADRGAVMRLASS